MNPKDAFGCLHDTRLPAGRTEHDGDGDDHDYVQPVLHIGAYEDDDTAMVNGVWTDDNE